MDRAEKITYLRTNFMKMSRAKFAKEIGVSRETVRAWEVGSSCPTTNHIMMIASCCKVTTDYLAIDDHPLELSSHKLDDDQYELLLHIITFYENENKKKENKYEK